MAKMLIAYRDWSGGLSELANDNMRDNMLVQAKNAVPGEGAGIAKASGYKVAARDIPGNIVAALQVEFDVEGEITSYPLAFTETALYRHKDSWEIVKDGLSPVRDWFVYGKKLYWLDGTNYYVYDGQTAAPVEQEGSGLLYKHSGALAAGSYNFLINGRYYNFKTTVDLAAGDYVSYNSVTLSMAIVVSGTASAQAFSSSLTAEGTTLSYVTEPVANPVEEELFERVRTSSFVEQRGQRWFFAREGYDEVIFTGVGNPAQIGVSHVLNVNSKNSDHITGLREFNEGLLIFKEYSVHYLTGWDFQSASDIQLQQLNVTSGTKFGESICTVDNGVLYLGGDGVYYLYIPSYTSVVASRNVSENKVSNTLYKFNATEAHATVWRGEYRLHVANGKERREYRYDIGSSSFWGPFTQDHSCYAKGLFGRNNLFVGCKNGLILEADESVMHYVATEASEGIAVGDPLPIPFFVETKAFDVSNSLVRDVKLKRAFFVAKQYLQESSSVSCRIKADYADLQYDISFDESMVYGESGEDDETLQPGDFGFSSWGWKETVQKQATVNRKAKRIRFYFSAEEVDEPLLLYGAAVTYKLKKVKASREGVVSRPVIYTD